MEKQILQMWKPAFFLCWPNILGGFVLVFSGFVWNFWYLLLFTALKTELALLNLSGSCTVFVTPFVWETIAFRWLLRVSLSRIRI